MHADRWRDIPDYKLDELAALLREPVTARQGLIRLAAMLWRYRHRVSQVEWEDYVKNIYRPHPCFSYVQQDPFARIGFQKPRGYAGDAVMIDLVYGHQSIRPLIEESTPLGQELYRQSLVSDGAQATRGRRDLIARMVDETASRVRGAHVCSIACGHLREAELSNAVAERRLGRYVAFDVDPVTLKVVEEEKGSQGIEPVHGSVKRILAGLKLGAFDFIYAAGLYDYLPDGFGSALLTKLVQMLNPGGCCLIANFVPSIPDCGHMEASLAWQLIYRAESDLNRLLVNANLSAKHTSRVFRDATGQIAYLQISAC
jgi:2-polyprenyl-3-methyl-5-hydroxy-6-metoxy-1,4-benzoquinol methylase